MKCNHQVRQEMASRWIRSKRPCYERRVNRVLESVLVGGGLGLVAALKTHVLAILLALAGLTTTASAVDSSFMDLGTLGGEYVDVQTISDDGSVVVGTSQNADEYEEAFAWTQSGGMVGLGILPGQEYSYGYFVSDDGSVVFGLTEGDDEDEVFVWTQSGGMVGLGILEEEGSEIEAISADGSIAVGMANDTEVGFLWDNVNGMRDLTEVLIADNSLESSLAGWDYLRAKGVSSDGLTVTIVGNGELDDSACEGCYNTRGWIARIESPVVPEPSSLILLGIALACLFGNARRSV